MKSNKEILDEFGRILIENSYDFNYNMLSKNIRRNLESEDFEKKINSIVKNSLESIVFDFLKIFEENEQFKLIYTENGNQVNLVEISEMLKAEPTIEGGWIDRFSKLSKSK